MQCSRGWNLVKKKYESCRPSQANGLLSQRDKMLSTNDNRYYTTVRIYNYPLPRSKRLVATMT